MPMGVGRGNFSADALRMEIPVFHLDKLVESKFEKFCLPYVLFISFV